MKEELISFETAKLAKEKGFAIKNYLAFDDENPKNLNSNFNPRNYQPWYFNLTQALLQKWLRDKKTHVEAIPIDSWNNWGYNILMEDFMSPFFVAGYNSIEYETYEEALEAGLLNALKLI